MSTTLTTQVTDVTTFDIATLSTTDKKGNRVSFERSVAFASPIARKQLSADVYAKQCANGIYGPLLADAIQAGTVSKSVAEILNVMLAAGGRNPSKETTKNVSGFILTAWANKEPKGQKAFYVGMVRDLARQLA